LAHNIGATQQAVNQWETGLLFLGHERAAAIAEYLEVDPDILFARHNLDTVTMYTNRLGPDQHLTHRMAVMLLTKIRKIMAYRWKLPQEIRAELNQTNRWLIQEAFGRNSEED
jgi:hypothetical protein